VTDVHGEGETLWWIGGLPRSAGVAFTWGTVFAKGWPSAAFCWGRISSEQRSLGGSVGTVRKGSRTVAVARGPKGNEVKVFLDESSNEVPTMPQIYRFFALPSAPPPLQVRFLHPLAKIAMARMLQCTSRLS